MKNSDNAAYAGFSIREENRVPGFDPLRFLKMTASGPKLDMNTKKTWFRMKYPEGRITLRALNVTEQLAVIEARIFLYKTDTEPMYTSTAEMKSHEVPGGLYVQAAQQNAIEQVLNQAGFTVFTGNTSVASPAQKSVARPVPVRPQPEPAPVAEPPIVTIAAQPIEETTPATIAEEPKDVTAEAKAEESTPVHRAEILDTIPTTNAEPTAETVPYTKDTPVEEICKRMTIQDALNYTITTGSCTGWTMAQALSRRVSSVKFFNSPGYKGDDNILRASAKILLDEAARQMAG